MSVKGLRFTRTHDNPSNAVTSAWAEGADCPVCRAPLTFVLHEDGSLSLYCLACCTTCKAEPAH